MEYAVLDIAGEVGGQLSSRERLSPYRIVCSWDPCCIRLSLLKNGSQLDPDFDGLAIQGRCRAVGVENIVHGRLLLAYVVGWMLNSLVAVTPIQMACL